jgi:PAS domain S-box-containing protein
MTNFDIKKKPKVLLDADRLRRRAKALLRKQKNNQRSKTGDLESAADTQRLLHELRVHQIELEMQNVELKRTRDEAEALLEKYTDLYDFAPISYFSLDEQGRILEVNLTGATLLGMERSRLVNRSLKRFVTPESQPILSSFLKQPFSGLGTGICEVELLTASGAPFWANLHGIFPNSSSHARKLCRVAISDITPLKQAEEVKRKIKAAVAEKENLQQEIARRQKVEKALRQSEKALGEREERLRLATEAAEFGAFHYDFARGEGFYTPEFLALFGLPANSKVELDSNMVPKPIHPDDRAGYLTAMKTALDPRKGSGTFDMEFRIILYDGNVRWLRARGRTVLTGRGRDRRPMYANGIIQDITSRKQSEQEIAQQRNELAHLSRITALGELAVSLAHELNQPLAAILSNAQAAQRFITHDQADVNEIREILADIVAEDKRAGEVIRHLRMLLRKGEVRRQPLDVNEVVREVLALVRNDLINQRIKEQTELARDLPVLSGNHVQIQQVLLSLVMNACEAMADAPPNDHQLTICTGLTADNLIHISVADRGVGIAPENLEQVFKAFYTTKPNGMGFGLTVCRTIVGSHGGKLWATNNPEQGSTFHITLPPSGMAKDAGRGTRDEGRGKEQAGESAVS